MNLLIQLVDGRENIPKSLIEVIRYFSDADVCIEFIASMRWMDGTLCPHCESKKCRLSEDSAHLEVPHLPQTVFREDWNHL
jgi:hypothetical protein